ncbi:MAG: hypothetical protein VZR95_09870 [Alphaproteobacteria bacterium]
MFLPFAVVVLDRLHLWLPSSTLVSPVLNMSGIAAPLVLPFVGGHTASDWRHILSLCTVAIRPFSRDFLEGVRDLNPQAAYIPHAF